MSTGKVHELNSATCLQLPFSAIPFGHKREIKRLWLEQEARLGYSGLYGGFKVNFYILIWFYHLCCTAITIYVTFQEGFFQQGWLFGARVDVYSALRKHTYQARLGQLKQEIEDEGTHRRCSGS